MLFARETSGFQEFLQTPDARSAPDWQIEQLAATQWPEDAKPTARTFAGLQAVLDAASRVETDRRAG